MTELSMCTLQYQLPTKHAGRTGDEDPHDGSSRVRSCTLRRDSTPLCDVPAGNASKDLWNTEVVPCDIRGRGKLPPSYLCSLSLCRMCRPVTMAAAPSSARHAASSQAAE
jgi:hypothetical protein